MGANLRDADLKQCESTGCIFLTQVQLNSAKGDMQTNLPSIVRTPEHWMHVGK
ncbi:hypothetical protein [Peribacillus saganii]|uniref:hypothetical protein n=1 Tax=Peribacillus saganii TaxID=2303992 RepID=UPI00389AC6CE